MKRPTTKAIAAGIVLLLGTALPQKTLASDVTGRCNEGQQKLLQEYQDHYDNFEADRRDIQQFIEWHQDWCQKVERGAVNPQHANQQWDQEFGALNGRVVERDNEIKRRANVIQAG